MAADAMKRGFVPNGLSSGSPARSSYCPIGPSGLLCLLATPDLCATIVVTSLSNAGSTLTSRRRWRKDAAAPSVAQQRGAGARHEMSSPVDVAHAVSNSAVIICSQENCPRSCVDVASHAETMRCESESDLPNRLCGCGGVGTAFHHSRSCVWPSARAARMCALSSDQTLATWR